MKKKDEKVCRLRNHNKTLLNEVESLKEKKKHFQNQEKIRIVDEETTKTLEVEICKKFEEELSTEDIKSKIQSRIEGRNKLMENVWQLHKEKETQDSRRSSENTRRRFALT